MLAATIATLALVVIAVAGHELYKRLPSREDGANAFFAFCAVFAGLLTLVGVMVGFVAHPSHIVWAIIVFVAAALLLALGFAGRRHIVRAAK